jgi:hypothetical protein
VGSHRSAWSRARYLERLARYAELAAPTLRLTIRRLLHHRRCQPRIRRHPSSGHAQAEGITPSGVTDVLRHHRNSGGTRRRAELAAGAPGGQWPATAAQPSPRLPIAIGGRWPRCSRPPPRAPYGPARSPPRPPPKSPTVTSMAPATAGTSRSDRRSPLNPAYVPTRRCICDLSTWAGGPPRAAGIPPAGFALQTMSVAH